MARQYIGNFGNHDAKVTIDDVQLLNNDQVPPVANNDTASTDAGLPVVINVLAMTPVIKQCLFDFLIG